MISNPSRLFIPSANPADPAFQWRLDLMWQEPSELSGLDHRRIYLDAANEAKSGPLSQATIETILALANDDAFRITEIDIAILTVTGWLHNPEEIRPKTRSLLIHRARESLCESGPVEEADIRHLFKLEAAMLLEDEIPRIRAKLAVKELAASLLPDQLIPHLIEISSRYLDCGRVQSWIEQTRTIARYSKNKTKRDAELALSQLTRAIQGDGRSRKIRKYAYWKTVRQYNDLSREIAGLRAEHFHKRISSAVLNDFCERWGIPKMLQGLILSCYTANKPKEATLTLLIDKKMIESGRAFKDLQMAVSRMEKRRACDFRIKSKFVEEFLDVPTRHPEMIDYGQHCQMLESVHLKQTE